jgi:hypothetical protein
LNMLNLFNRRSDFDLLALTFTSRLNACFNKRHAHTDNFSRGR